MDLKRLGAAALVVAAIGAVLASSASAAATTTDVKWYTGTAPGTELVGSAALTSSAVAGWTIDLPGLGGESLDLFGIECEGCKIENSGGTAVGSGKLKFTGVTVTKPEGCSVASTITTKALTIRADYMIGSVDYWLFEPAAGSEAGLFTVELTGAECPVKTAIVPKGTLFMKAANATGTQAAEQELSSSAAINSEAGGNLHVGSEAASMTGSIKFNLASGTAFGTH